MIPNPHLSIYRSPSHIFDTGVQYPLAATSHQLGSIPVPGRNYLGIPVRSPAARGSPSPFPPPPVPSSAPAFNPIVYTHPNILPPSPPAAPLSEDKERALQQQHVIDLKTSSIEKADEHQKLVKERKRAAFIAKRANSRRKGKQAQSTTPPPADADVVAARMSELTASPKPPVQTLVDGVVIDWDSLARYLAAPAQEQNINRFARFFETGRIE